MDGYVNTYRDGTSHVIFEPLDFIAKLAALVPKPRVNLTRYHGVFAPNCKFRAFITGRKKAKDLKPGVNKEDEPKTDNEKQATMTWAKRLKRVFNIDITTCRACGGKVKIIACIEEQAVIDKILKYLKEKGIRLDMPLAEPRGPPQHDLFNHI